MSFVKFNINPLEKKTGDCVIRTIASATNQSWEKVYKDLTKLGLIYCEMPNSKNVYQAYLKSMGWEKRKTLKKDNNRKYTVNEMAIMFKDDNVICQTSQHLTIIEKGDIIDTWNCGAWCVGNFFIKN